ncbi:unnamed protein product [Blepharisma stoltei]|uniref:DJ-1/PfpI domain-containing protein n=1 Tax=Blepharisma stoltei TaxID=1481888 RepID=A0AAU9JF50_9CILI|nr:unnamed protein product [Blepharisma stoltei]
MSMKQSPSRRYSEGSILILALPCHLELPQGVENIESGIKISNLLSIHKVLTTFAFDWEIGTLEGEKPSVINDDSSEDAVDFYRSYLERLNSPTNLNEIRGNEYSAIIIPSFPAIIANFKGEPLINKLGKILREVYLECKGMLCIGHGIAAAFESKDAKGKWIFDGFNIASVPLIQQWNDEYFPLIPFLIEDKIRELGGNFCSSEPSQHLIIIDRKLISCQCELSLNLACTSLGYLLRDSID